MGTIIFLNDCVLQIINYFGVKQIRLKTSNWTEHLREISIYIRVNIEKCGDYVIKFKSPQI